MDLDYFSKLEELKNNSKINIVHLPGYKNNPDEILFIKKKLFSNGVSIESLKVNYNQKFNVLSMKIAEYIEKKYSGKVYLLGLSFGGVLAIKLAKILGNKIEAVFSLNPFYDRKEIMEKRGIKDYEEICVKDFIPIKTKIFLIAGLEDSHVSPENSRKIKKLNKNIELVEIKEGDHTFSTMKSQEKIADFILSKITI